MTYRGSSSGTGDELRASKRERGREYSIVYAIVVLTFFASVLSFSFTGVHNVMQL